MTDREILETVVKQNRELKKRLKWDKSWFLYTKGRVENNFWHTCNLVII